MTSIKRSVAKRMAVASALALALAALAATLFAPDDQPFGYVAPPALDDADLAGGAATAFVPWFDFTGAYGDLIAAPVTAAGAVNLAAPRWRAAEVMNAASAQNSNYWKDQRFIVTWHPDGYVIPFRRSEMAAAQVDAMKPDDSKRIEYLRGRRDEEGNTFRARAGLLGDIIHSEPTYVGAPRAGHTYDGYASFASANAARPGRVYVGANDGMLHAFDAATGREVFAYVPSMLFGKLKAVADIGYTHHYLVDGQLTAEDAFFGGTWHTLLIGGLGGGGKGLFALDVTSAAPIIDESSTASGAGSRLLWEFGPGDLGAGNLGYTYGRQSVVRLENGQFAVAAGNGYLSATGAASLYLLDAATGNVIREIVVGDADANGMSSPTLVDADGDGKVDTAYAGDLNGNLWKFDLSSDDATQWDVAYAGMPLLQTEVDEAGVRNAITTAPEVGRHPRGGLMVYVAAGRLFSTDDALQTNRHAVYGIRDLGLDGVQLPIAHTDLQAQTLSETSHGASGARVRTASSHAVDWATKRGWKTPLEVASAEAGQLGERVIFDIQLRNGAVNFVSVNPTSGAGRNWLMLLDAMTGGAPTRTVLDVNGDGVLDLLDNVDGNGDGTVADVAEDRVVGRFEGLGLASPPTFGRADGIEVALVNRLSQVDQVGEFVPPPPSGDDGDPGLVGGHFDLDVASQTYAIDNGSTDDHKHEWDTSYGTVVDLFDILGGFRSIDDTDGLPGQSPNQRFLITMANAWLSPAAQIEINGVTWSGLEYTSLMNQYIAERTLSDTVVSTPAATDYFPIYKLGAVTEAEAAQGIVQLTSLKVTFPNDAILRGGIHPSQTGCVRGNDASPNGEYRNGSFVVQLLDASAPGPGYVYDPVRDGHFVSGGGSHAIHRYGHALPKDGTTHGVGDGMLHELTIFWHWSGACYNAGDAEKYALDWLAIVGTDDSRSIEDVPVGGTEEETPEGDPDVELIERTQDSSDHSVSNTAVAAGGASGRLFWREVVPDE